MEKLKMRMKRLGMRLYKVAVFIQCLSYSMVAQATEVSGGGSSLGDTKLVQGILNLCTDAGKVLLVIEVAAIVVLEIAIGLKYQFGEDEDKPKHKKNAKITLAVGALILTASGFITVVFSYFQ